MVNSSSNNKVVAKGIRLEIDPLTGDLYLIFKIVDEQFKQKVREDWENDVEMQVDGKDLIEKK